MAASKNEAQESTASAFSTASRTSLDSDLRYMELNNAVRPSLSSVKRTSRHFGSQSPELPDDIEEQLTMPHVVTHHVPVHSKIPGDTDDSLDSGHPQSLYQYLGEDMEEDEEERRGVFDYFQSHSRDNSPPPPSTSRHVTSQNTQAYDDAFDADFPTDSPSEDLSPHATAGTEDTDKENEDIEMQTFKDWKVQESNDFVKENNSLIYDESYEVAGDSEGELTQVVVEPSAPPEDDDGDDVLRDVNIHQRLYSGDHYKPPVFREMHNDSRPSTSIAPRFHNQSFCGKQWKSNRPTTHVSATSVDSGVNFSLGAPGSSRQMSSYGGSDPGREHRKEPPFGDPLEMQRLCATTERLLDGKRTTSTNTTVGRTDTSSHLSDSGRSHVKKKAKKGRNKGIDSCSYSSSTPWGLDNSGQRM